MKAILILVAVVAAIGVIVEEKKNSYVALFLSASLCYILLELVGCIV